MAAADYKFEGWMGTDKSAAEGNMVWQEFEPKPWEETDVDIKITHCGICGSDIHTLRSGWSPTNYPCCVGHEIVGKVVRVGSQAGAFAIGDRVGVGAQSESCGQPDCTACAAGNLQYCPSNVGTYNATHRNGGKSYGGYATYKRCPGRFVIKIPPGISSAAAAPMLCGGITTYLPLQRFGAGPGRRVGIVGLGGLGHMGVMWARAMDANRVVVISRKSDKKADALDMGAHDFIATAEDPEWAQKNANSLDLIICTVASSSMPLTEYLALLRFDGVFVQVGAPEGGMPSFSPFHLIFKRVTITGSMIGSPDDIKKMLELAEAKNLRPWIQEIPMKDANKAIVDMEKGKPRYRYTLVNEE